MPSKGLRVGAKENMDIMESAMVGTEQPGGELVLLRVYLLQHVRGLPQERLPPSRGVHVGQGKESL